MHKKDELFGSSLCLFNYALFDDDIGIHSAFARYNNGVSFFRSFIKFKTFQIAVGDDNFVAMTHFTEDFQKLRANDFRDSF